MAAKKDIQIEALAALLWAIKKADGQNEIENRLYDYVKQSDDREPTDREKQWYKEEINYWFRRMSTKKIQLQ